MKTLKLSIFQKKNSLGTIGIFTFLLIFILSFSNQVYGQNIRLSSSNIKPGESVTARFSGATHTNAWIGLYKVGDADTKYVSYVYTRNAPSGYTVKIEQAGQYQFRLFNSGSYDQKIATSSNITVATPKATPVQQTNLINLSSTSINSGQSVTARFSGASHTNAWIGLYKVGDADTKYVSYVYTRNSPSGYTVKITQAGQYQFRLFNSGSYDQKIATSQTITVR